MATCVPIEALKNVENFTRLIFEASEPITVTKNGYGAFVVMQTEEYLRLQIAAAKLELMEKISIGDDQYRRSCS